tara:strand:- start:98 stop:829 length:732 start_codon:yes stop_codon:yes gene_type:complete
MDDTKKSTRKKSPLRMIPRKKAETKPKDKKSSKKDRPAQKKKDILMPGLRRGTLPDFGDIPMTAAGGGMMKSKMSTKGKMRGGKRMAPGMKGGGMTSKMSTKGGMSGGKKKMAPGMKGGGMTSKMSTKGGTMGGKKKAPGYKAGKMVGSKFPDLSGDGKVTQKDILMGKGVIKKKGGGKVKPKGAAAGGGYKKGGMKPKGAAAGGGYKKGGMKTKTATKKRVSKPKVRGAGIARKGVRPVKYR